MITLVLMTRELRVSGSIPENVQGPKLYDCTKGSCFYEKVNFFDIIHGKVISPLTVSLNSPLAVHLDSL